MDDSNGAIAAQGGMILALLGMIQARFRTLPGRVSMGFPTIRFERAARQPPLTRPSATLSHKGRGERRSALPRYFGAVRPRALTVSASATRSPGLPVATANPPA